MVNTPQKDAVASDDDLFNFYLSTLPPFLNIDTTVKDEEGRPLGESTACSVGTCKKSKIRKLIDEGRVRSRMVDGKRKIETYSLLKYLFNSPGDKPTELKHAPLAGKRYRRVKSPDAKRDRVAAKRAGQHERVAERV